MRKRVGLLFINTLLAFTLLACGRSTNHDRPVSSVPDNKNIQGELLRVNPAKSSFVIRAENGMEQTFTINATGNSNQFRNLAARQGTDVRVHWTPQGNGKMAVSVD
jgi:hypothetical protein